MATSSGIGGSIGNVSSLLNMILGSTTKTTSQADTSALQSVYAKATANANDTTKTKTLIDNIMQEAAINFAGTAQQQNTAGLYNSNVHNLLQGWSKATATQKASDAVLNYQTTQDQIAANAAAAIANATRGSTAVTGGLSSGTMLAGAAGLGGLAAFKYRKDISDFISNTFGSGDIATAAAGDALDISGFNNDFSNFASDVVTKGAGADAIYIQDLPAADFSSMSDVLSGTESMEQVAGGIGTDALTTGDIGATVGIDAAQAAGDAYDIIGSGADMWSEAGLSAGDVGYFGTTVMDTGEIASAVDAGTGLMDAAGEAFGSVMDIYNPTGIPFFPTMVNLAEASPLGDVPIVGDVIGVVDNAYDAINSAIGGIVSAITGGGRVICTELWKQGLMPGNLLADDLAFTVNIPPATIRGYHLWAIPTVKLMKRSKLVTNFVKPFALWRALEISYQLGNREDPCYRGKLVRLIGEPLCWLLGQFAAARDWTVLNQEIANGR